MRLILKYKTLVLVALCQILSITLNGQSVSPPSVAVLDFDARGIPVYEVETLTERFRTEIANTGAIRLIDRKLLQKILEEQGLQQSGCTTDECAAEVGQLLGAQYIINGSIGKIGNSFTIDVKMVSVTTGAAERSKSVSYVGAIDGLLTEMEILAWEIVNLPIPNRLLLKRGGEASESKITLAVLDFDPRGISTLEAQTLTDRFASELNNTNQVNLVDRRSMNEVLEEQGFESEGCTSEECAAEVGALLGVQYMVNGAIGKIGNTFTIDAKMFSVSTGVAERTKSKTYAGPVDGLITEIELLAWDLMELTPPSRLTSRRRGTQQTALTPPRGKTRFGAFMRSTIFPGWGQFYSDRKLMGWVWLGSEVAVGTLAYTQFSAYQTSHDDYIDFQAQYRASADPTEIGALKQKSKSSHSDMMAANDQMTTMLYALGGIWAANVLHAVILGPKDFADRKSKSSIQLTYNRELKQPQLRWSIALD